MSRHAKTLELTLAILKPDLMSNIFAAQNVRQRILKNGFYFVKTRNLHLTTSEAAQFYGEHEGKFFFNRLVTYMTSGPIRTHILARDNAIKQWRMLLGATKVNKTVYAEPDSIRGEFGLSDTRNCVHGSDSPATARREINFFFPDFNIEMWMATKQNFFLQNKVSFNENLNEHLILPEET
ncbi:hypothetical protein CAPTEDRAFT_91319 [Capitella teleta]|uniref:Nucleoside diphosphate kinase n=1 Tax=Capitella teleta TaxID=283909 RepID=R7UC11_CAPTE|nr:hypothetical protein CAPTEDRAFT_91319 [Capitella teleta]|eukprot:ELU03651.1 hypothetical protein CAPTEDRAFT_91319 [Capitella teleta]